jgi:hypothetical protein
MPYTFTVTQISPVVTATVSMSTVTVNVENVNFTLTNILQMFTATRVLSTVTVYQNAIELRVDDFSNYFKGDWVSGTTYVRGDLVNSLYSLYVSSIATLTNYVSTIAPAQDPGKWRRVVWHEAPFDHVTVTNDLIVGQNITGNGNITSNGTITAANSLVTPLIKTDTISTSSAATLTFSSPSQFNQTLRVENTVTMVTDALVQATLTAYDLSISRNAGVAGQTTLANTQVNGLFTATQAVNLTKTLNVVQTATLASLNVGSITGSGAVTISAPTTINNTLTVSSISVGGGLGRGVLDIRGLTTTTTLTVESTATFLGTSVFTGQIVSNNTVTFNSPVFYNNDITAPRITVGTLTAGTATVTRLTSGGTQFPLADGEYGQVIFTNGTGTASWVNLGDLVFWQLSADLQTNGYDIRSINQSQTNVFNNGTTSTYVPLWQDVSVIKSGTNYTPPVSYPVYNPDNYLKFGNNPSNANPLIAYKDFVELKSGGDVTIYAGPGLGPTFNGPGPGDVVVKAEAGEIRLFGTGLKFNDETISPGLGYTGSRGSTGYNGSAGPAGGYTGSQGYVGSRGTDGTPGGPIGYTGSRGADGAGYTLPAATVDTLGGVKVDANGQYDYGITYASGYILGLKSATTATIGGVRVDSTYLTINTTTAFLSVNTATLNAQLQLPIATTSRVGGIAVGTTLVINSSTGVLDVNTSTVTFGHISFTTSTVTISGTSTIYLTAAEVRIGLDNNRSKIFVERIEAFDGGGSVFFPGGVRYPDNTIQLTAYAGNFGVLGDGSSYAPLQIRRGAMSVVNTYTPYIGEFVYSTSTRQVFIGDGTTAGGIPVASATYNNFDFGSIV